VECVETEDRPQNRQSVATISVQDVAPTGYAAVSDNASALNSILIGGEEPDPMAFESVFPEFFEHVMMPFDGSGPIDNVVRPPDVSNYTQDLSFAAGDFDFSLLDDPAGWMSFPLDEMPDAQQTVAGRTPNSEAGPRSEALKRSPWSWNNWIPPIGVGAFSERDELNVREERVNAADQLTSRNSRQISHCSLEQCNRDQMIRTITKCTVLLVSTLPPFADYTDQALDLCLRFPRYNFSRILLMSA
jgi:hypothetical protein